MKIDNYLKKLKKQKAISLADEKDPYTKNQVILRAKLCNAKQKGNILYSVNLELKEWVLDQTYIAEKENQIKNNYSDLDKIYLYCIKILNKTKIITLKEIDEINCFINRIKDSLTNKVVARLLKTGAKQKHDKITANNLEPKKELLDQPLIQHILKTEAKQKEFETQKTYFNKIYYKGLAITAYKQNLKENFIKILTKEDIPLTITIYINPSNYYDVEPYFNEQIDKITYQKKEKEKRGEETTKEENKLKHVNNLKEQIKKDITKIFKINTYIITSGLNEEQAEHNLIKIKNILESCGIKSKATLGYNKKVKNHNLNTAHHFVTQKILVHNFYPLIK